ncbi:hypothetical protein D8B26_002753 [Coccidioides posadasii str. Silveira]|uniref:Uncharacterized protein n=2 Tax=Coccidioides posadasii TaxID=199306 RepID=E9CYE1_COCPS|nr:conserved hypothetical protein [Coccidioides posadasii str. Silveira]KMM72479.1 flavin containing monooxygenase 2 [Coccidioides posadasii RMSCC 3488]QVM08056.1 hypothetical protein D8B26_002753 [Coccidioides posadasii str. Silveira]
MSGGLGKKVCVIGAGGLGLAALKNLVETGFDVTVFERASYIGGLWHVTTDPDQTSVLPQTRAVLTKYSVAYTDFPMSEESDRFPTAAQMCEYVEAYAKHFDLHRHIRLNTTVVRVLRDEADNKWLIEVRATDSHGTQTQTHVFDRLVFATGIHLKLNWPNIKGRQRFAGDIIHGLRMKEPSKYRGKRVLIIGLALTGADCARHLAREGAEQVYCSHRRQVLLIPRVVEGKPLAQPMRSKLFTGRMEALAPAIARIMAKRFLLSIQEKSYPEMRHHPILNRSTRKDVHIDSRIPVYADNLVPLLKTGQVKSVQAVDEVIGPHSVRLVDGTVLDNIDAIVCATGATTDASALLPPQCDPANPDLAPDGFALIPETYRKQRPVLRLYQNWLSLQHPHSLAILGYAVRLQGSFPLVDVVTSAMAQLWSGGYPMPSQAEMERNVQAHYRHIAELLKYGDVMFPGRISGLEWDHWHDKVAGAGIYDRLGNWRSLKSWKLWWNDPELYKLLMDGTSSPHLFRLFDTGRGRKPWDGARAAIEKANKSEEETIEKWKRQQAGEEKH